LAVKRGGTKAARTVSGGSRTRNERVQRRIEEWKRKLVDLSRRNRLLYFYPSRTSTLKVEQPTAEHIFMQLATRAKAWKFWAPLSECSPASVRREGTPDAERSETAQAVISKLENEGPTNRSASLTEISVSASRKSTELACNVQDPVELVQILKNLARRSHVDFRERGVRILHFAFGMIEWRETENGETIRSPLVLVPVEIVRKSPQDPFELRRTEDDAVLNPALEVKLRNEFHIELPPIPEDWRKISPRDYLNQIARRVQRHGYSVVTEAWIGLFSFHKGGYLS